MASFLFWVMSIPDGREIRRLTLGAVDEYDAISKAFHMARLQSAEAEIGKTYRVVYPRGVCGGEAWVLLRQVGR